MKDIKKLEKLLKEFNVGYAFVDNMNGTSGIMIQEGSNSVCAYSGFYTLFSFDEKGSFVDITISE